MNSTDHSSSSDMADPMDVDSDAPPDKIHRKKHGRRIIKARRTSSRAQQGDLMKFSEPQQEDYVNIEHEGLKGSSPKQTTATKQKMGFVDHLLKFLGRSSGPHGSQQGLDGVDFEEICARGQEFQDEIDALRKANEGLEEEKEKAEKKNQRLRNERKSFSDANEKLLHRNEEAEKLNESLVTQLQALTAEKEDHRKVIAQLKSQINDLTHDKNRFRQMIVPVSEKQVPDSDVGQKFIILRSSILRLVRQTWTTAIRDNVELRRLPGHQRDFFGSQLPLSYDRIRSVVFEIIHGMILGSQCYFLGEGFNKLEQHVRTVEKDLNLNSSEEDRTQVIEWRVATFKATERFRDNGRCLSSSVQDCIWSFLSPLQTRDEASEQSGRTKVKAACDNAVELSLMIRQLKDDFKVDDLAGAVGKPISQWDGIAEDVLSVPARLGGQPGTIAYVITGALIKSPRENPEKDLPLEKAQVAVYE